MSVAVSGGAFFGVCAVVAVVGVGIHTATLERPPAPAQPVVSATVPAPPPSPVTPVPAAPPVSEPNEDEHVVIVPVPLPHGDDDHRGWIHRRACRHTIWC